MSTEPGSTASVSSVGSLPAGTTYVPLVDERSISAEIVAVADELGVPTRHAGVAVERDLGVDVTRLARSADQRGVLRQRDGRRRRRRARLVGQRTLQREPFAIDLDDDDPLHVRVERSAAGSAGGAATCGCGGA